MCSRFGSFEASKKVMKKEISCITVYYQVMAFPICGAWSSIYVLNNVLAVFVCVSIDVCIYVCVLTS